MMKIIVYIGIRYMKNILVKQEIIVLKIIYIRKLYVF